MLDEIQREILERLLKGEKIRTLAKEYGVSERSVSHLRRDYSNTCIVCGKPLTYCDNKQPKRFCCDACRTKWWNANRDLSKRKTAVKKICPICGKEFYSYKKTQVFCSQECFSSTTNNNDIK
ncbi:MAG: helix-turn-helix domain-containing protein [Acholeplasma sp.]|nr:helix-turn-helix domain-containing protein [Acholeplasma sp.]